MKLFNKHRIEGQQKEEEEQNEESGLSFTYDEVQEFIQDCLVNPKYKMPNKFEILNYFKVIDKENNNFLNTKQLLELLTKKTDDIQQPLTRDELKNFVQFNSLKKNKDTFHYDEYCQDTDLFFQQHKKQYLMQQKPYQLNKLKDIQKRGKKMKIKLEQLMIVFQFVSFSQLSFIIVYSYQIVHQLFYLILLIF